MKTTKHTPGPWSTEYDGSIVMNRQIVSGPIAPESADREEHAANAALIAAAPDLLAACKEAIAELTNARGGYPSWNATPGRVQCALNLLRAAIARAEGGAK